MQNQLPRAGGAANASPATAQNQPVPAPKHDNFIDLTFGSDTKAAEQKPALQVERRVQKYNYRAFVPGQPIRWSATTSVQSMLRLVEEREDIFAKQRKINLANQPRRSTINSTFKAYLRFCKGCNLPPFPMTNAILALCMFAKCSETDGVYRTFKGEVVRLAIATQHLFADAAGYDVLKELEPFALEDFMHERASMDGDDEEDQSDEEDESDEDEEDADEYDGGTGHDADPVEEGGVELDSYAVKAKQRLPTSRDSFNSFNDLFAEVVGAVIPIYGISVSKAHCSSIAGQMRCNRANSHWDDTPVGKCPFRIQAVVVPDTGRWKVDESRSIYSHSHGPTHAILHNPDWRPKINNPIARRKMGLPTRSSSSVDFQRAVKGKAKRSGSTDATLTMKKRKTDKDDGTPVVVAAAVPVTPVPSNQFANILQGILGVWNGRLVPLASALIAAGISSWADWGRLFDMPQIALDATLDAVR